MPSPHVPSGARTTELEQLAQLGQKAFETLIDKISARRDKLVVDQSAEQLEQLSAGLGEYRERVQASLSRLRAERVISRIWKHDHTVWKPDPKEIGNRLGWLHVAEAMLDNIDCLEALADDLRAEGYTNALLLGMGGSSLAPEVLRKTFGVQDGYLDLDVLDSTDPGAVLYHTKRLAPVGTLFIVSTKSGDTIETLSFFKFYYNWVVRALGEEEAGRHFVAITDPGSLLTEIAKECGFRATFTNDPDIGGRYSALSYFGLVPAALIGVDLEKLLNRALGEMYECVTVDCSMAGSSLAAALGVTMSELARAGRDKLTLIVSPDVSSFGDWVEQLIAESTGKEGKGIVPVVGEPLGSPGVYGDDRLFCHLRIDGDSSRDSAVQVLEDAGHPVVRLRLRDVYDLGQQFFAWEMATAVAGYGLGINPFDQPDVEKAKKLAQAMMAQYKEIGKLPEGDSKPATAAALTEFVEQAKPKDYIALQAYVQPTPETDAALLALRLTLRDHYRLAVTVGYGPRFLHSTGQLHKGDRGNGIFVQLLAGGRCELDIPNEAGASTSSFSFNVLKAAQALGDAQALREAGRRVLRLDLGKDVTETLAALAVAASHSSRVM